MSSKLEGLRAQLGTPDATFLTIANHFEDQAWKELVAKVGLPEGTTRLQMYSAMEHADDDLAKKLLAAATELGLMKEGMSPGAEKIVLKGYYDKLALNRLEEAAGLPKTEATITALGMVRVHDAWAAIEATLQ